MKKDTEPVMYIRFRKRVRLQKGEEIALGRVADVLASPALANDLRRLVLSRPGQWDGNMVLIDMLQVVERVSQAFPGIRIEHFGEPHVLVEIEVERRVPRWIWVVPVWLLLFVGSGLAIMNFHADVSMLAVHQRIFEMVTGERTARPYLLQIPYSLGIGAGMVLFFNHLFKRKFNEEPSPLEVEMYLYQENMNRYIVMEEYGKKNGKEPKPHEGSDG